MIKRHNPTEHPPTSSLTAFITVIISLMAILGWYFDSKVLQSWHPEYVSMNPVTAGCLIILSISHVLSHNKTRHRHLIIGLISTVIIVAPLRYISSLFGIDIGIDSVFFASTLGENRVAPNTALLLTILAVSQFVFVVKESYSKASEILSFTCFFISLFCLLGYLYSIEAFYGIANYIPMAVNTAVALVSLSLAQIFKHLYSPNQYISILTRPDMGGEVMRVLGVATVVIPLLLGWLFSYGRANQLYGPDFMASILSMSIVIIFLIIVWALANRISSLDKSLREEGQILELVLNSIADGVIVSDKDGNITRFNPSADQMLGVRLQQHNPAVWSENYQIYHDDKKNAFSNRNQPLSLATKGKKSDNIQQFIKYKGKRLGRHLSLSGRPLLDKDYNIHGGVVLIRDITKQKKGEQKILKNNEFLKDLTSVQDKKIKKTEEQVMQLQKMDAVGRLAGGVAHDFNNILAAIHLYSDLCIDHLEEKEKIEDYAKKIKLSSERGAALTRQLLLFSRQEALNKSNININEIIENHLKMLDRILPDQVKIKTKLGQDIAPILSDPIEIEQILINLLINSRDALKDSGNITIETANTHLSATDSFQNFEIDPGDYVLISVSDNGHGMSKDIIDKIFDPFFTTKPQGQGTGLGLSIIYGIVRRLNGCIEVFSEIDKGTTFNIYIPKNDHEENDQAIEGKKIIDKVTSQTILLVEDEEELRGLTADTLIMYGHTVLIAENEDEALDIFKKSFSKIDILLTDLSMKGIGGVALSEECIQIKPDIKILYISGTSAFSVKDRVNKSEYFDFLQKPFDSNSLITAIQDLADR